MNIRPFLLATRDALGWLWYVARGLSTVWRIAYRAHRREARR